MLSEEEIKRLSAAVGSKADALIVKLDGDIGRVRGSGRGRKAAEYKNELFGDEKFIDMVFVNDYGALYVYDSEVRGLIDAACIAGSSGIRPLSKSIVIDVLLNWEVIRSFDISRRWRLSERSGRGYASACRLASHHIKRHLSFPSSPDEGALRSRFGL